MFLIPVVSPNRQDSATLLDNDIVDDTSGDFKQLMRSAAMVSLQGMCNLVGKQHPISREDYLTVHSRHSHMGFRWGLVLFAYWLALCNGSIVNKSGKLYQQ